MFGFAFSAGLGRGLIYKRIWVKGSQKRFAALFKKGCARWSGESKENELFFKDYSTVSLSLYTSRARAKYVWKAALWYDSGHYVNRAQGSTEVGRCVNKSQKSGNFSRQTREWIACEQTLAKVGDRETEK